MAGSLALAGCGAPADDATLEFWSFTGIQQDEQVDRYLAANPAARIELSEIELRHQVDVSPTHHHCRIVFQQ